MQLAVLVDPYGQRRNALVHVLKSKPARREPMSCLRSLKHKLLLKVLHFGHLVLTASKLAASTRNAPVEPLKQVAAAAPRYKSELLRPAIYVMLETPKARCSVTKLPNMEPSSSVRSSAVKSQRKKMME